jgi:CheY-like chemotaxis protein
MAKILIVDDEPDASRAVGFYLEKCGHRVTCVPNGREALVQVLTAMPDVVLLDLIMPEMDGVSFLEVVRSYLRLVSLPVVVVTGMEDSPILDRLRQLKVTSTLIKGRATVVDIKNTLEAAAEAGKAQAGSVAR